MRGKCKPMVTEHIDREILTVGSDHPVVNSRIYFVGWCAATHQPYDYESKDCITQDAAIKLVLGHVARESKKK